MKTFVLVLLGGVGLVVLWSVGRSYGFFQGKRAVKKVARALKANHPQPFEALRNRTPIARAEILGEVLRPYLLDDDFVIARRIIREMETADLALATLAELEVAMSEGNPLAAEQAARKLVMGHPKNVTHRAVLAQLVLDRGALEEAEQILQAGDLADPVLAHVMIELLELRGEHEQATRLATQTAETERRIELRESNRPR